MWLFESYQGPDLCFLLVVEQLLWLRVPVDGYGGMSCMDEKQEMLLTNRIKKKLNCPFHLKRETSALTIEFEDISFTR